MFSMRRPVLLVCAALALGWQAPSQAQPAELKIFGMDSRPVSFQHDGRPDGMAVELAAAIEHRIGRSDDIEIIPWARAYTMSQTAPNVLLLSMVRTPERARYLTFVGPIFVAYLSVFAPRDRAAQLRGLGPEALHQLRGGAQRGSVVIELARDAGFNVVDETNTSETAARMLMMRRFDLWFDGEEVAADALRQAGYARDDVEVVQRLRSENVYFAFSRGTPEQTVAAWDAALRELKRDGGYQKILRKWMPAAMLPVEERR
ncbi:ABC transporter substrate-binding protein [Rugamonas sp.]|uniref:substrate-binding periplasmic protein n=1 Tax=Rugamonas sp. TaxID=1926287 RepID=UPI0025EB0623|nr:transporter substrate-binding domain-containing protein [Rugamonas sp.]